MAPLYIAQNKNFCVCLGLGSSNRNVCHSQLPISKLVSFSVKPPLAWVCYGGSSEALLSRNRAVGEWVTVCIGGVWHGGPDRVSADRRGIEPDFSMGRNRPLCQLEGEGKGAMWGMWGNVGEEWHGSQYGRSIWMEGRGHMWPVCTSRTSVGERSWGGRGGDEGGGISWGQAGV